MCSGVKKVFDAVVKLVRKVWNAVRKYLVYIVVIAAVFYPFLWSMVGNLLPATWAFLAPGATSIWGLTTFNAMLMRGVVGLAIGFLLDKETTRDVVDKLADVVGETAEAVVEIGGGAIGGALSGIVSSPLGIIAIGALVWLLFLRDKGGDEVVVVEPRQEPNQPLLTA